MAFFNRIKIRPKPVMPDLVRHPGLEAQSLDSRLRGHYEKGVLYSTS